jgi:hypothetical protein
MADTNYYEHYIKESQKREELEKECGELRKRCEMLEGELKKRGWWESL